MWPSLLISLFCYAFAEEPFSRITYISQGPVLGFKDGEYDIFVFKNIPYATVPKGVDKFKAPLSPPTWQLPLRATDKDILCPQLNPQAMNDVLMQEECLIANVYVPDTGRTNLPVVVYFHGGAYIQGFGNSWYPKKLVDSKKVIAVTFNYRLGAHGFLCLGTDDIPGNAGSKDQVTLLRWVKKNIANFGGDPDDITIAGYSAGASSVDLVMLSKMAKGLFNKVIPESGANTAAFSIQSDPIANAKEYAKLLDFDNVDDINALGHFFKNITLERLNSADTLQRQDSTFLLSPCVEKATNEESFLNEDPVEILKSGKYEKVPMLYGFANMEGLFRIEFFDVWKDQMNKNFADFLPADLEFENENTKQTVAARIKKYYFSNEEVNSDNILTYVDYFTDVIFAYPILRSVKLQVEAANNKIYLYEYSFTDESTPFVPHTNVRGAGHCAQTFMILDPFTDGFQNDSGSRKDSKMQDTMLKIWLNFITMGNPSSENVSIPQWIPVGEGRSPYMSLNETSTLRNNLIKERAEFWDEIYDKYYRRPKQP